MKTVQICNVPDELHRRLTARAALEGKSLSEFALGELRRALERPTRRELIQGVRDRTSAATDESAAAAVRAERDAR
ncbi:MAG TPA: hypothetical protein VG452_04045 [Egibacteraceae bacterium]|nr:hypothetical protein [Actinomycetota bacterium]HWB71366.1 hypothetical protein [Egibacteraceae bacterium]